MKIIRTSKDESHSRFSFSLLMRRLIKDHIFESAATLSYYFLFSVFPLTILLSAAFSTLEITADDLQSAFRIIPDQIVEILGDYLTDISSGNTLSLILFGLALTIYSLGKAVQTLKRKFKIAYSTTSSGSFLREWIVSAVFVLLMLGAFFATFLLILVGDHVIKWLLLNVPMIRDVVISVRTLRYFVLTAFLFFVIFGLYYLLPGIRQKKRDVLPGTFFALATWLLCSWGFSFYVDHFADYTTLYGSLGSIIILLTWLFLINVILLIGVYINVILKKKSEDGKSAQHHAVLSDS